LLTNLVFRLSALLGKGLYFAGDVCTIEERPEGVPGIPSDPICSKHKALCTRPAWYWITMPGAGADKRSGYDVSCILKSSDMG